MGVKIGKVSNDFSLFFLISYMHVQLQTSQYYDAYVNWLVTPNLTCLLEMIPLRFVAQSMRKLHSCILLNSNGKNTPLKIFTTLLSDPKYDRWGQPNCQVV